MTYNKFITQYPWVDFILMLFGNIAPVVVAIVAIIVNNTKSSKRDKRNKKIDMIVNYENLLINKISELEEALDDLLDAFLGILKCEKYDSIKQVCETYDSSKRKLLKCNIELYNLSFCASEILKENVNSKDILEDIKAIINTMDEIIKKHLSDSALNGICDSEKQGVEKIKDDIIEAKSWLSVDIKRVMEKTFDLLK